MKRDLTDSIICVVGLGYVGLPLARAFAEKFKVIGFDTDSEKLSQLSKERNDTLIFTTQAKEMSKADFIIICVPTPVTPAKEPDLSYVTEAAKTVGRNMKKGAVVILESTVFPGVTEDVVRPILERESGLKCGRDFKIGYSPERVNPGDDAHNINKITKVAAGMDEESSRLLAKLYSEVASNVFVAKDIKTAEAAKVIENIQRDLNIALMNELAIIFEKMGLNTKDVLDAAATKWNFHRYSPGLVGGYCIPVVPYYLVHKAKELNYHPRVILAGRAINDSMPKHVAGMALKALKKAGKVLKHSRVLLMGLTYKENVLDTRESPVKDIIKELSRFGVEIYGYDPLVNHAEDEFNIKVVKSLNKVDNIDAVIVTVAHDAFKKIKLSQLKKVMSSLPVLIDVRQAFDRSEAEWEGFYYQTL